MTCESTLFMTLLHKINKLIFRFSISSYSLSSHIPPNSQLQMLMIFFPYYPKSHPPGSVPFATATVQPPLTWTTAEPSYSPLCLSYSLSNLHPLWAFKLSIWALHSSVKNASVWLHCPWVMSGHQSFVIGPSCVSLVTSLPCLPHFVLMLPKPLQTVIGATKTKRASHISHLKVSVTMTAQPPPPWVLKKARGEA